MKYAINLNFPKTDDDFNSGIYPVIIYHLIRQHSNNNNKLTIEDIYDTLFDYWQGDKQIASYRKNLQKTIKRNLTILMRLDPKICAEKKDGTIYEVDDGESPLSIQWIWYEQELNHTDLQLLTDAVIYSKHLTNKKRREILANLFNTIGDSYTTKTPWFQTVLKDAEDISVSVSIDLYKNLEFINDAIEDRHCISFDYFFSGPRGEKYIVKSFSEVSPYKIIHNDGTYYLVASRKHEQPYDRYVDGKVDPEEIILVEIHKLTKMSSDFSSKYIPIEKTQGRDKTIQDFLSIHSHPIRSQRFMFFFTVMNDQAILEVNAEGLDIIIDKFGNRMSVRKLSKTSNYKKGTAPELKATYEVTLRGIVRNDWYELVILRLRYPLQIVIKKPEHLISGIIHTLERLEDKQSLEAEQ